MYNFGKRGQPGKSNALMTKNRDKKREKYKAGHKMIYFICFAAMILLAFYLLGWPTDNGPYKYAFSYFRNLIVLTAVFTCSLIYLVKKVPVHFKNNVSSKFVLVLLGVIFSILSGEMAIGFAGLAEYGGGQGPLQPDFKLKKYKLNSMGFRGPEVRVKKDEKTTRIIGLGDSTAFGQGVA